MRARSGPQSHRRAALSLAIALALLQVTGCTSLRERLFGVHPPPPEPTAFAPPPAPAPVPNVPGGVWGHLRVLHAAPGEGDLGTAIVYLERVDPAAATPSPSAKPAGAMLSFDRGRVVPARLAASVGQPIRVEFHGGVLHQPFTVAEDGSRIDFVRESETGGRLVLDQPGVFRIYCSLHGDERGVVYAVGSPLFAMVADDGRYGIEPVPVGAYRLVLWSDAVSGPIRSIEVESGARLESPIWIDARKVER